MRIYLIEKATKQIIREFDNVIDWSIDYVEYYIGQGICKEYCDTNTQYFTDEMPN